LGISNSVKLVIVSILNYVKTLSAEKFHTAHHNTNVEGNRIIVNTLQSLYKDNVRVLSFIVLVGALFLFINPEFVDTTEALQSGDRIHNVNANQREYTIDTAMPWRLPEGGVLHVSILNANEFPEAAEIVKKALSSEEVIKIKGYLHRTDSKETTTTFYSGWTGALKAASFEKTSLYIPINFNIVEFGNENANIIIDLTPFKSENVYSANTNIVNGKYNQLLKAYITIYEVDQLSLNYIRMITTHEMGHALGLAHSTDPNDIMFSTLQANHSFLSECNVKAIVELYNGAMNSKIEC